MSRTDPPVPGLITEGLEATRFAAERDEDARRERWLLVGQVAMLVLVVVVVGVFVAVRQA
jgi:hypothetical protein